MNNKQSPTENIWEWIKLLLALAPVAMLFVMFTAVLGEMLNQDFHINFWLLLTVWVFLLLGFVKSGVEGEEDWERIGALWTYVWYGFWGTAFSTFLLYLLLQLTLKIDILELDEHIYLMFLVWAGWIVGLHFYYKHKEELLIQEQLGKLRRKETVYNAHPKVMERYKQEEEALKKYEEKRQGLRADPLSPVPDDPANPRRQLLTEMQKETTKEEKEPSLSSRRLLIPLNLSAEEALEAVKAHLPVSAKQNPHKSKQSKNNDQSKV